MDETRGTAPGRPTAPAAARATPRTASPSTARAINDRLALQLLQNEGPLTAGELKTGTGLSRPTVADLVERLQAAGLIAVVGESGARRRGPNARLYGIVADRAHLAAVDLRTDSATIAVADLLGRVQAETAVPVGPDTDPAQAAANGVAALEKLLGAAGAARPHAVAVGAPGLVDPATGRFRGTEGCPPGTPRSSRRSAPCPPRPSCWRTRSTSPPSRNSVTAPRAAVTPSSCSGSATAPAPPSSWTAGCGAVPRAARARSASCPYRARADCPPPRAATAASIRWRARRRCANWPPSTGSRRVTQAGPTPAHPAEALVRAAVHAGEAGAAFLDALAARIALGVAAVCAVLDPGCVVLGGETGRAGGDALAERVADHLARMSPLHTEVRAGTVGGRAVLRGAVLAAMDAAQDDLFGPAG